MTIPVVAPNVRKLRIADGYIGKEYYSKFGNAIQLLNKTKGANVEVLVLPGILDKKLELSGNYVVFEKLYNEEQKVKNEEEVKETMKEKEVTTEQIHNDDAKYNSKFSTARQLVLSMLESGPQTRESMARAILDAGLAKDNKMNKARSHVSIILFSIGRKINAKLVKEEVERDGRKVKLYSIEK